MMKGSKMKMIVKVHNIKEAIALVAEWNESLEHSGKYLFFKSHEGILIAEACWDNMNFKHVLETMGE